MTSNAAVPAGTEIPLFRLPDGAGAQRGTLDAWQRRDMLLAALHGDGCAPCRALWAALAKLSPQVRPMEIEVLAVAIGQPPPEDPLWREALRDPNGHVLEALAKASGGAGARLWVVNRFGAVYASLDAHAQPAQTLLDQAMEWMDYAQRQCAECSAPVGWAEDATR